MSDAMQNKPKQKCETRMGLSIEKRLARRHIYCALPLLSWHFWIRQQGMSRFVLVYVLCNRYYLFKTSHIAIVTFPNIWNVYPKHHRAILFSIVHRWFCFNAFELIDRSFDSPTSAYNFKPVCFNFVHHDRNHQPEQVLHNAWDSWHHNDMPILKIVRTMRL